MKAIIGTNVLLVIIPSRSEYHIAYQSLIDSKYELGCSNEILLEYEEQLKRRYDIPFVEEILANFIDNKNIRFYDPGFNWNLIRQDPDDNKFLDCAIAANADFIVTNDNHFNILKEMPFPKVKTIRLQEFVELLRKQEKKHKVLRGIKIFFLLFWGVRLFHVPVNM